MARKGVLNENRTLPHESREETNRQLFKKNGGCMPQTGQGRDIKTDVGISTEELDYYANIYLTLNGSWSRTTFEVFLKKMMERKRR